MDRRLSGAKNMFPLVALMVEMVVAVEVFFWSVSQG